MSRIELPWDELHQWDIDEALHVLRAYSGHDEINTESVTDVIAFLEIQMDLKGDQHPPTHWWDRFMGNKEKFEFDHKLLGRPSIPSETGWTIYHPAPPKDGYIYRPKRGGLRMPIQGGHSLKINGSNTFIDLRRYRDFDGDSRVRFDILDQRTGTSDSGTYKYVETIQKHITQKGSVPGIDTRRVVYENADDSVPENSQIHTFEMTPAIDSNAVGVIEVEYVKDSAA